MRVDHLYRYPVKGLTAEALDSVMLEPGAPLPWDRAFALAQGDSGFDPATPTFLPKSNFMCLLKNAAIARLRAAFDPHDRILTLHAPDGSGIAENPLTAVGRERLGQFLTAYLGEEARGAPRFHYVPGHAFADNRLPLVSLISLSSLHRYEADIGAVRDKMRFRGNLYFNGALPWAEFDWIGRSLEIGGATLRVVKRLRRCDATQVNPGTAERDADPVRELQRAYGHTDLGVLAEVLERGPVAVGDTITLLP